MADGWTQARGYAAVTKAAAGRCQITGRPDPTDHHHRLARSQGGTFAPWNLLMLDHDVHMWLTFEADREACEEAGWIVPAGKDPEQTPVWLTIEGLEGWWMLVRDDLPHPYLALMLDVEDYHLPARPRIMPPTRTGASA